MAAVTVEDERIELIVSQSQLLIETIRQQVDWKLNFESAFNARLKAVEELLKKRPGSKVLLETKNDIIVELERLRSEVGPVRTPHLDGEHSKDLHVRHQSDIVSINNMPEYNLTTRQLEVEESLKHITLSMSTIEESNKNIKARLDFLENTQSRLINPISQSENHTATHINPTTLNQDRMPVEVLQHALGNESQSVQKDPVVRAEVDNYSVRHGFKKTQFSTT